MDSQQENRRPNFFVIGVVKGGTTSLYHYLSQHPDIYLPSIKETNHFAAEDIREENFLPEYARDVRMDIEAYIRSGMKQQVHIAHVSNRDQYERLFSKAKDESAIGEISNSYMISPGSAKAIYEYAPEGRIIVVLRNPIYRVWSQYLMNIREAKSDLLKLIPSLLEDRDNVKTGWGVNHQYLELGNYATQLRRYLQLFGRDKVLAVFYEEYRESPQEVMSQICSFLQIDSQFEFDFSMESNKAGLPRSAVLNKVLVKSGAIKALKGVTPKGLRQKFSQLLYTDKNLPKLTQEEKDWLSEYYAEEVKQLQELLQVDAARFWPEFKSRDHEVQD